MAMEWIGHLRRSGPASGRRKSETPELLPNNRGDTGQRPRLTLVERAHEAVQSRASPIASHVELEADMVDGAADKTAAQFVGQAAGIEPDRLMRLDAVSCLPFAYGDPLKSVFRVAEIMRGEREPRGREIWLGGEQATDPAAIEARVDV